MRSNLPRLAMLIVAVNLAMLSGCTQSIVTPVSVSPVERSPGAPRSWPSVFPSHTLYGSTKIVPPSQVAALPKKIAALSTGHSESIEDLVQLLGLSAFRTNVSINMRWNHHFMYLDEDHILYMTIDCEHLDSEPFVTPWNARVIACKLMRNPDVTIIEKDMGEKKMLDDQRTGANKTLEPTTGGFGVASAYRGPTGDGTAAARCHLRVDRNSKVTSFVQPSTRRAIPSSPASFELSAAPCGGSA